MSQLFNRQGVERTPNMSNDRYTYVQRCLRCGGVGGSTGWPGYTCFSCGGNGTGSRKVERLYPAEQLAKLNAIAERRAAAKAAKVAEEQAAIEAERAKGRSQFKEANKLVLAKLDDLIEWTGQDAWWINLKSDLIMHSQLSSSCELLICERHAEWEERRRLAAVQRELGHLGEVGKRYKVRAKVVRSQFIKLVSRFPLIERWLVVLQTEQGHELTWWTGQGWELTPDFEDCSVTVKALGMFNGKPQTTVQRVTFKTA